MNKKLIFLFCTCVIFFGSRLGAQSIVSVSPLTGAGSINIPVYAVRSGQVSMPVSLYYTGTGVKPKDVEGTAGMNWQLVCGGEINRLLRGLPDDCNKDNTGLGTFGWMSASDLGAGYASSFVPQNDNSGNCTYETNDISNINTYMPYQYDTEPDIFYVSAPGLSCSLIFDRTSGKFKPIEYQDLIISYASYGPGGDNEGEIYSFTITNDRGVTYLFNNPELITQTTSPGSGTPNYFKTKYLQYQNGITYADGWYLSKITDANGNAISLSYTTATPRIGVDPVLLNLAGATAPVLQYDVTQTVTPVILQSVTTTGNDLPATNVLSFSWNIGTAGNNGTNQTTLESISAPGRYFQCSYYGIACSTGYTRLFLHNFADIGDYSCNSPLNYTFDYAGESGSFTTLLPDSSSKQLDYWGFYSTTASAYSLISTLYVNPSNSAGPRYLIAASTSPGSFYPYTLTENNRQSDPTVAAYGALTSVTYAQGGSSTIVYEPNDYIDYYSGVLVKGGGIRVKQVTDAIGTGATNNIVRNYSYTDPVYNQSSGLPVTLPQYGFSIPYSGSATGSSLWSYATAVSGYDLSAEDHTIMYAYSKLSQTGAGYTQYAYNIPANAWSLNAAPSCSGCATEWYPSAALTARYTCTATYGPASSAYVAGYPFIPNPNYDFERGLIKSVKSYTDAGVQVSESDYTYARSSAPSIIYGVKTDDYGATGLVLKSYNRYINYYNTEELTATVTSKVFDSSNSGTYQTSTTTNTYNSTFHKLSQQSLINSDGSTLSNFTKYTKDYTISGPNTNPNINALYYIQQQNINMPVESYQRIDRGSGPLTTGASLTLFNTATAGTATHYLPSQQFSFTLPDGGSFTPMTISGTTLTRDANYTSTPVANFDQYDSDATIQTADDGNKRIATSFTDHTFNNIIAAFSNAAYNEVAFNDFDSTFPVPGPNFTITGTGSVNPVGHTGAGYNFGSSQSLTKTVAKNVLAQNYIFSVWANSTSSVTLNISLVNGTNTDSKTIVVNTGGVWKYFETRIPLTGLPAGNFSATVTLTAGTVAIDDALLYPDVAEATTFAYDATTHFKTAATNTNGVSAYYNFDRFGRLVLQYDQDKNIVQKNTYVTPAGIQNFYAPGISSSPSAPIYNTTLVTFTNGASGTNYACYATEASYTWDFGDGSSPINTTSTAPVTHTFATAVTSPTNYTVTLSVTSPYFGVKSSTKVITVVPPNATIKYTNDALVSSITSVVFTNGDAVYTFTAATLNNAAIPAGTYTVAINASGKLYTPGDGKGYNFIGFKVNTGGSGSLCLPWTNNPYSYTPFGYTFNAGDVIDFAMTNGSSCTFP